MTKLLEASEQLTELNAKLAIQKIAVTEKTEACEVLLEEISRARAQAEEKMKMAGAKGKEIEEQSVIIVVEKVQSSSGDHPKPVSSYSSYVTHSYYHSSQQ